MFCRTLIRQLSSYPRAIYIEYCALVFFEDGGVLRNRIFIFPHQNKVYCNDTSRCFVSDSPVA